MRLILGSLALLLGGYALLVWLLYSQQARFLFLPTTARVTAAEAGLAGVQDVTLTTDDGERLVAWWRPPEPGRAVLLYFHGNGGSLLNRRERAGMLLADGRGLLMMSYRGYSGSTGSPSEDGLRRDAEAAYRYLSAYHPARIVLYGESLGSGVAISLAAAHRVGGAILDSPFTSVTDVARPLFWFVPVDRLIRNPFRSIDRIASIGAPLLVLHGEEDRTIPIALGERLFAAAKDPKRFVRLPGVDHVGVLEEGGLPHVRAVLDEVETSLSPSGASAAGR